MPVIAVGAAVILVLVAVLVGAVGAVFGSSGSLDSGACPAATDGPPVSDIPPAYLALYRKAGTEYGIPWPVLAAVGKVESDHGRSNEPGVKSGENSAGAGGPMQFLASTWASFGVDGNGDGRRDRYDPADAIPAAARYLRHDGAPAKTRAALFAYDHSTSYVNTVLAQSLRYSAPDSAAVAGCLPHAGSMTAPGEAIAKAIAFAMAQRGKPYVFGATGPNAWDCSSLVQAAYRAAGYTIPRTTFQQWPFGVRVPRGTEQPGDLVFFNTGPGTSTDNPGHVGMVISPGKMIAARCSTCRPNIGVESYRRGDWIGTTRPLLKVQPTSRDSPKRHTTGHRHSTRHTRHRHHRTRRPHA